MMSWVFGWLRAISRKIESLPEHMTLMGMLALAPERLHSIDETFAKVLSVAFLA